MAYNLARNSRVFVTTNLSTASGQAVASGGVSTGPGQILAAGLSTTNTFEIQVLDGFKFSQGTNTANVQVKEAGATPVRGQRNFNTALNPVDITFSTYIRPRLNAGQVTAEERVLWNALMGSVGIEGTVQNGSAVVATAFTGTLTTAVRASTTSPSCTITSALTLTPAPTIGNVYTIKGVTGTGASYWNAPIRITGYTAGVSLAFEYLDPPDAAAGLNSPAFTTAVKLDAAAWVELPSVVGQTVSSAQLVSANSNKNQMQAIGFIFVVDSAWYGIDNAAIDQAQVDFGLDAIATIAWTAKATRLNSLTTPVGANLTLANPVLGTSGTFTGTALGRVTTANFLTNKLSTLQLVKNVGGVGAGNTSYNNIVLTGGSITYANNITYVTPNNIGVLNIPIGYFTGSRVISGSLNAYLKTGAGTTAQLLSDLLSNVGTATETKYRLQIEIGGNPGSTPAALVASNRVEIEMVGALIGIPSVDVADIISTTITFSAQSIDNTQWGNATGGAYDIENTNDLEIRYYSI